MATVVCLLAGLVVAVALAPRGAATPGPGPYDVSLVVDTNPDPAIVEADITAEETILDLGNGLMANMWTYNGSVPGPQFRLNVGDTVIVHFTNLLPEPTGIHWHGIELPNASDGTPLTQNQVATNETFTYKFIVPRPGVFWYHPHHHASTNHVSRGMYGSMIITDDENHESALVANGVLPSEAQTKTLVLADTTVCAVADSSPLCSVPIDHHGDPIGSPLAAGEVPNIQVANPGSVDEGRTVLTNGVNVGGRAGTPTSPGALAAGASTLDVEAGQGLRLQLVNAAAIRYFRLVLTDNAGAPITLFRVGGEGGLLDETVVEGGVIGSYDTKYPSGEILLGPGDRADVVAVIPPSATGVLTLWTQGFARFGQASNTGPPTATVAHFNVNGTASTPYTITGGTDLLIDPSINAPVEALPAATASLLDPSTFSPAKAGLAAQNIALTNTANVPGGLGVDHVQGAHDAPGDYTSMAHMGSARYAQVGDVLELTVTNETKPGAHHPFHLHGFSIQPLSFTPWAGADAPVPTASYTFPYREFMDEIDIPAKYMLTFRVRLDDRPQMDGTTPGGALGRWIFHCHLFHHATFGMVSEFDVVAGDGNERPYVNADDTPIAANVGDAITNTGTWMDPDGDAVTLSASVGTVVQDPGGAAGTWAWSYTVPAGAPEQVYITATDAGGRTDQAVFALDVNEPPVVTIDAAQVTSIVEGGTLSVAADFTDTGDDEPYAATIDYGTGAGPQAVTPTVTDNTAPIAGTVGGTFQYGDNGTFTVTVAVTDSRGATGSANFAVTVSNVDPDGNITGGTMIGGVQTFFADIGATSSLDASIADPGSDDLTTTWNFGDLSAVATQTSLVNDPATEPLTPSPSVQPRGVTHPTSHAYATACAFTLGFASLDDDGGTDSATASVIITRPPQLSRGAGNWQHQYGGKGKLDFTTAVRLCYLQIAGTLSSVFNEVSNASTISLAFNNIFVAGLNGDMNQQLDRQLLTAWLNFANGGVEYNEMLDTDKNGSLDTAFNDVMATAEAVRLNPASTKTQLQRQRDILSRINTRDGIT